MLKIYWVPRRSFAPNWPPVWFWFGGRGGGVKRIEAHCRSFGGGSSSTLSCLSVFAGCAAFEKKRKGEVQRVKDKGLVLCW